MEGKTKIVNTFNGGLDSDSHLTVGSNNDYRYGLNLIKTDEDQTTFISNEHSNRLVASFSGNVVLPENFLTAAPINLKFLYSLPSTRE